jgi:hypothetical protein
MDRDRLIDDYLASVRGALRHRRDADSVLLELEDHLRESVEGRHLAGSDDPISESLAAFGSPTAVTRSLLLTSWGGLALPTRTTRLSGALGLWAAVLWAVSALAGAAAMGGFMDFSLSVYWSWAAIVGAAGLATGGLLVGVMVRSGATGTSRWTIGTGVLSLVTAVATVAMTWLWAALLVPLSMLGVAAVVRLSRLGVVDHTMVALALAWPVGTILLLVGEALELGRMDEYGDHPIAFAGAYAIAALLWAILLARIGSALRREEPVDLRHELVGA